MLSFAHLLVWKQKNSSKKTKKLLWVSTIVSGCGQKAVEEGSKTSEVPSENLESVSFKIDGFT